MQRRGMVTATVEEDGFCRIEADVPLAEMFKRPAFGDSG